MSYYYANVVFTAADGSEHHILSTTGVSPKPFKQPGSAYPVRYNPDNPREAQLDSAGQFWGWPVGLILVGALIMFSVADPILSTSRSHHSKVRTSMGHKSVFVENRWLEPVT